MMQHFFIRNSIRLGVPGIGDKNFYSSGYWARYFGDGTMVISLTALKNGACPLPA